MTEMSPAEAIFLACLEKVMPEQQLDYLNQACAGQPELRASVEKLLAFHPRVGVFLEAEPTIPPMLTEAEGTIVAGRYKLLQQIGEGGMGSVWMADQTEPVKRRVAVKLIRIDRGNGAWRSSILVSLGPRSSKLDPLQGMPLQTLTVSGTKVADVAALRGMPLKSLRLHDCAELTDLSPLAECKELVDITLPPNAKNIDSLRALPKLERIGFNEDASDRYRPNKQVSSQQDCCSVLGRLRRDEELGKLAAGTANSR